MHVAGHAIFVVIGDVKHAFLATIAFHENDSLYTWPPDASFLLPFLRYVVHDTRTVVI